MRVPAARFSVAPYSYEVAHSLQAELGIDEAVAVTLARRGYVTPEAARAFLAADESHDPFAFEGMEEVVAILLEAVTDRKRITVYGDYDVDGVCSTSILVSALRELGVECDWAIPSRLEDGYGLTTDAVRSLAARGTGLILTADCGVTCVAEVALANELGIRVIVTDHHQPGPELPACPIVHPEISHYPYPELCATGVAYKLACALGARTPGGDAERQADLDLVALATVADLVPLTGENRSLVRRGLAEARRGRRPGLRALIIAAGCSPERLDETDLSFRLAPRINAAGRLYRADAGVELMLTGDPERAGQIALELDRANLDRRETEREVLAAAEAAVSALAGGAEGAHALVLWGEGWHPGVVGIVASRLVERYWRPVILLGVDEEGRAKGSGRSVPRFDLLGGLRACDRHLARYGGHRAAAGLELAVEELAGFRAAFDAHAAAELGEQPPPRERAIDAIVSGAGLGLELAEQLGRLGPFGKGNPCPTLLVPGGRIEDVRPMGESGAHARFSLRSGGARAIGVAFGVDRSLEPLAGVRQDIAVKLELNHWNGAVEARVLLEDTFAIEARPEAKAVLVADAPDEHWWARFEAELGRGGRPPAEPGGEPLRDREVVDRRERSALGVIAALLSAGEVVIAVAADASRRAELASLVDPARFGAGEALVAPARADREQVQAGAARLLDAGAGLLLTDWAALSLSPSLADRFRHVVAVDPPPDPLSLATAGGEGWLHLAWDTASLELSIRLAGLEWPTRELLGPAYRALRDRAPDRSLRGALGGRGDHPDSPERAARRALVLIELGLISYEHSAGPKGERIVLSPGAGRVSLEDSVAFRAFSKARESSIAHLRAIGGAVMISRVNGALVLSSVAADARAEDSNAA